MKHEQHYSAQFALSSRDSKPLRTFLRCIALVSSMGVLASCGNSTEVSSNTNGGNGGSGGNNGGGPAYSGPTALNDEVQKFKTEFWNPLAANDRCGQCHTTDGQAGNFPFVDLLDINAAFAAATSTNNSDQLIVDRDAPGNSRVVLKVANGHQCWGSNSDSACADIIEGYIDNWTSGSSKTGARSITLTAPRIFEPGRSRNFPDTARDGSPSFETSLYNPILVPFCSECHSDSSNTPQAPFFASGDLDVAYAAAMSKINLDAVNELADSSLEPLPLNSPEQSRFVTRILELHNCWTANCSSDADLMRLAIFDFAKGIPLTEIDPQLITSKAMTFADATLASGGNRYENDQIALWEFKTGSGNQAFDTSGIEPAMNLDFTGSVGWVLGYGIEFSNGGFASALPETSKKLSDLIRLNNAYSIEAWLIPANVTQEDRRIISYTSGSGTTRNFSMSQTLYQYEFLNRSTKTNDNGRLALLTLDDDEDLQSALQHVVYTFDPVNGRRIYVNGVFTDDVDEADSQGGSLLDWDDSFPFVLGGETGDPQAAWNGKIRMVAIHNSALNQDQIDQNFSVGVGQKYFMMFSVGDLLSPVENEAFVVMQAELYDSTAYLFNNPIFINLDGQYIPAGDILIDGMRIGVNGREAVTGQVFGNINLNINAANYTIDGQTISRLGTVVPVGKGPDNDEFFLTFERIANNSNVRTEPDPSAPQILPEADPVSKYGIKTFDEINASMSQITGIPTTNNTVATTFASYEQQLPATEDIKAFLASHQMGVAQMAMTYCQELVIQERALASPAFFSGFNFTETASVAFNTVQKKNAIIDPLLISIMNLEAGNNLTEQADPVVLRNFLGATGTGSQVLDDVSTVPANSNFTSLIEQLKACATCNDDTDRTAKIVIGTCAAIIGSAITIIQ